MTLHYDGTQTFLKCKRQIFRRLHKIEIWIGVSLDMSSSKYAFCQELFRIKFAFGLKSNEKCFLTTMVKIRVTQLNSLIPQHYANDKNAQ